MRCNGRPWLQCLGLGSLVAGYRDLSIDYENDSFVFDAVTPRSLAPSSVSEPAGRNSVDGLPILALSLMARRASHPRALTIPYRKGDYGASGTLNA
jgi:hypothetical protein